jgi:hypothetical protein
VPPSQAHASLLSLLMGELFSAAVEVAAMESTDIKPREVQGAFPPIKVRTARHAD